MSAQPYLASQLLATLDQGRDLLASIDPELYRKSPQPIASSTIGAHVRHVLDGLGCLAQGAPEGAIDYDRRERDERIEEDPRAALARLDQIGTALAALEGQETRAVRARSDVPAELGPDAGWSSSTLGREILFGLSHTIHHFALIAMILRFLGGEPPEGFGVAPSTLRYWKEVGRCAPLVG